ncbi:MAG: hypothetical protein JWR62_2832 [Modestobacter sp.]|jgi:hypothetical protein|nr:hypothetical protein [Modestobacter sp.]
MSSTTARISRTASTDSLVAAPTTWRWGRTWRWGC